MGYLGAKLTRCSRTRSQSGRVTQRCHNSPDGKRGYRVQVTSRTGSARRILGILRKSVKLNPASEEDGRLSLARRSLGQVSHEMGAGRWKRQNRRNVYLSPYVEESLNSKVIKSFIPELRNRFVFFEFRDSCILCIYVMNIPYTFCIFIYMAMVHTQEYNSKFILREQKHYSALV